MITHNGAKNVADAIIICGSLLTSMAAWAPAVSLVAGFLGIVYTVVRLIIEWPALVRRVKSWFQ